MPVLTTLPISFGHAAESAATLVPAEFDPADGGQGYAARARLTSRAGRRPPTETAIR